MCSRHDEASRYAGHDLAADLLADLTQPKPIDPVFELASQATNDGSSDLVTPQESSPFRPAVQWLVCSSPLDWRKPSLSLARDSTAMHLGPIRVELALMFARSKGMSAVVEECRRSLESRGSIAVVSSSNEHRAEVSVT